jgi:SLOG family YspA-like protein
VRVLVTASRTWSDAYPIRRDLGDLCGRACWEFVVVHGGADGGDTIAAQWVADQRRGGNNDVSEECHLADWKLHGRAAGIVRNVEMVRSGIDVCLAYIRDDSKGATHCAMTAEAAGIETRITRWTGNAGAAT